MGCLEEDMEGLNLPMEEIKHLVTSDQLDYIQEIMPLNDRHILIDRIDEIGNSMPPKAIDADKEISDLIAPLKEGIEPIYLEAPQDHIQIERISDTMAQIEGLEFYEWKELPFDKRVDLLQNITSVH